jgi:uncharacterized protein YegL
MISTFGDRQRDGLQWLFGEEDEEEEFDFPVPGPGGGDGAASTDVSVAVAESEVKRHVEKTGVAEDVRERFRELTTREVRVQARSGPRLDMRNVVRRLAGDTTVEDVYERYETIDLGDRTVGVALDMSNSMSGDTLEAKSAVGALCSEVQKLGDTVVVVTYQGGSKTTTLTGPREEWHWSDLDDIGPSGGTPTATGVEETASLMEQTMSDESILFVVTDGEPNSTERSRKAIENVRERGHAVIGIGFGTINEWNLRRLFGEDGYVSSRLEELADDLVEAYSSQINTVI